jgi:hypothetical protein
MERDPDHGCTLDIEHMRLAFQYFEADRGSLEGVVAVLSGRKKE